MCVDYRVLNDSTADTSWPIPNIAEIFRRIGIQKPKIFGIMDLTQGYHQAPLTLATRAYTSFITFSGIYQFTRLPFGPKRAPSYFQEIMATVVLTGLIYMICEMYIDCDKQRYYLDLAKSRGRIGSIASQQCLYQLSILCK